MKARTLLIAGVAAAATALAVLGAAPRQAASSQSTLVVYKSPT